MNMVKMEMSGPVILLILTWISLVSCQVPGLGGCPNPPVQKDFSVSKYMGRWYEIERYFPIVFELGDMCGQAIYTLKEDRHVRVENKGYNKWSGRINDVVGDAFAPNASEPAKLYVTFGSREPSPQSKPNYLVLSTDYTSYALVYSCSALDGLAHADILWILGREKELPESTIVRLKKYVESFGIRSKYLTKINQKDCPLEKDMGKEVSHTGKNAEINEI